MTADSTPVPEALAILTAAVAEHTGRPAPKTTRRPVRVPEHLRTDDMPSYLRQKGELA